ncbi:cAMP-binding domain of CRP or a regulatory subunit of cAMP-dependent protein kinases [Chitinophaga sp. YR573]|uniref:Crp/Fnr family transcriptional regulator n=1 Tax=Chitinophaga sp. YR573 TaxID=1881040 RepID=UPI0008B29BE1|nr:Crp/Fnr family transcriptional regulator [Chitinophaga sp. YR573]SEW39366.1 cAMP-binding domain of CRP or a regulatory subunit of cAMP-dependent protein kinases [Chitinophaga sp. YR573]
MFEFFAQYLVEKGELTQIELELIRQAAVSKKVRKNHYLLEEGKVSNFIGFVANGCFRLFRKGEDGQEYTMKFAIENWWISDFTSFMSGEPSNCYIEALENSELIWFSREIWDHLLATIPNFKRMIDSLTAKNFEANQNRIFSNISEPAEVRYDNFVNKYPTLYNRIPLYMIASFLGITRETLSRIRKQAAKK